MEIARLRKTPGRVTDSSLIPWANYQSFRSFACEAGANVSVVNEQKVHDSLCSWLLESVAGLEWGTRTVLIEMNK